MMGGRNGAGGASRLRHLFWPIPFTFDLQDQALTMECLLDLVPRKAKHLVFSCWAGLSDSHPNSMVDLGGAKS